MEHLLGVHLGLQGRGDELDTALEARVKDTLTTTTGKNLGLDNHILKVELLGDSLGLTGGHGSLTSGNTDTVALEKVGRAVLMQRKGSFLLPRGG